MCLAFQRQHHPERCAGAGFAFTLNLPAMCFDNHLGLKHADAQSLLLCGLKGTEKRGLEKLPDSSRIRCQRRKELPNRCFESSQL